MDGKTFREKSTYVAYLLEKGHAYAGPLRQEQSIVDNAVVAEDAPIVVSEVSESPLGNQNRTVADMFDAIEQSAKKRRRKSTDCDSRSN